MLRTTRRRLVAASRRFAFRRDPVVAARRLGVRIGERCRMLGTSPRTFGSEPYLISIGDHVTVTGGVRFVTHDGGVWVFREERPSLDIVAPIAIGNNVFIGLNVIIMPGVTLGDNTVVAAGSVVTRSFEGGAVIAGVPARRVRALDEYRQSAFERGVDTKGMDEDEKRRVLTDIFRPD